jgi:WD repeat-containing protein 23
VYIYNMDATIAGTIDVRATTANLRSVPERWRSYHRARDFHSWSTCVRDVSWHPNAPFIAGKLPCFFRLRNIIPLDALVLTGTIASSLNGWDHGHGTVSVHSFNEGSVDEGEPRMGTGYSDKLKMVKPGGESEEDEDAEAEEEDSDWE